MSAARTAEASWDPLKQPFRVTFYFRSAAHGLHGWNSAHRVFAAKDEAMAYYDDPKMRARSFRAELDVVEGWTGPGSLWRWQSIAIFDVRRRKKKKEADRSV